jgi:DNA-binding response OmpR family regulator
MAVRVADVVAKRVDPAEPWQDELIFKIHRLERERQEQTVLPLPDLPRLPYVRLSRSRRAEGHVEVFGQSHSLAPNRAALLWLLAERANYPVPTYDILESVYGRTDGYEEALKQLVKNLRKQIAGDWFSTLEPGEAKRVAESVLANDAKAGYILNARVVIED